MTTFFSFFALSLSSRNVSMPRMVVGTRFSSLFTAATRAPPSLQRPVRRPPERARGVSCPERSR
jgi:hypothetical protein